MCSWGKVLIKRCKKRETQQQLLMSLEQKQGNGEHKQGTVHVHALHTTTGVDKNLSHPLG